MDKELTVQDLILIIGNKEIELAVERARVAKATEIIKLQQDKITKLEDNAKDVPSDPVEMVK